MCVLIFREQDVLSHLKKGEGGGGGGGGGVWVGWWSC